MECSATDKEDTVEQSHLPAENAGNIKVTGHVIARLIKADGTEEIHGSDNLIVTAGKTLLADILSSSSSRPSHMAIGSNATAPDVSDTTLNTETARVALDSATPSTNTVAYQATFGAGVGTGGVEEAGLLNASSSGTMLARWLTGTFTKGALDVLVLTWTITFS